MKEKIEKKKFEVTIELVEKCGGLVIDRFEYKTLARNYKDAEERALDYYLVNLETVKVGNSPFELKVYSSTERVED